MCSQTWYSNPYRYVRDTLSALSKNEYKRITRILVGRFLRQDFSIFTPIFYAVPLSRIHLFLQKKKKAIHFNWSDNFSQKDSSFLSKDRLLFPEK